ncbi:MAG: Holliday junction branch migration protein RuvA [bacterium]
MISYIQGKIIEKSLSALTVLTSGGVGYDVSIKPTALDKYKIGDEVQMPTFLAVGESMLDLYGFENSAERELFIHFKSVSGIGPKSALHLLSLGTVEEITGAISAGDVEYLTKVSGVGRKTAERVVVELKSKMGDMTLGSLSPQNESLGDVVDGLVAMGYSMLQARESVRSLQADGKSTEQIMREALQKMK